MNLGKFQKIYLHAVDAQGINCDCMDCTAVTWRDTAALRVIEELERALDAKNEGRKWIISGFGVNYPELSEEKKKEYEVYESAVKRYKDYGIE